MMDFALAAAEADTFLYLGAGSSLEGLSQTTRTGHAFDACAAVPGVAAQALAEARRLTLRHISARRTIARTSAAGAEDAEAGSPNMCPLVCPGFRRSTGGVGAKPAHDATFIFCSMRVAVVLRKFKIFLEALGASV